MNPTSSPARPRPGPHAGAVHVLRVAFSVLTGLLVAAASSVLLMLATSIVTVLALDALDTGRYWWALPAVVILPAYVIGRGVASAAIAGQPQQSGHVGVFFGMVAGVLIPPAVLVAGPMPLAQLIVGDDEAARRRVPIDFTEAAPVDIGGPVFLLAAGWMLMLFAGALHAGMIELRRLERVSLQKSRRF